MHNIYYDYRLTKKDFRVLLKRLYSTKEDYFQVEWITASFFDGELYSQHDEYKRYYDNEEDFYFGPIENYIGEKLDEDFKKKLNKELNKIAERSERTDVGYYGHYDEVSVKKINFGRLYRLIVYSPVFDKIQNRRREELFDDFLSGKRAPRGYTYFNGKHTKLSRMKKEDRVSLYNPGMK